MSLQGILFCVCLVILVISLPIIIIRILKRNRSWQISLRGLMVFVTLFAVWISQFSISRSRFISGFFNWDESFYVLFVWIVLASFYIYHKSIPLLIVHCAFIGLFSILFCLLLLGGLDFEIDYLRNVLVKGFLIGSLASFPFCILILCEFIDIT
jgi:hypothetical protein